MSRSPRTAFPLVDATGVVLRDNARIIDAIATIDQTDARIALVVNDSGRLIGSLTDGDVRRGLLRGKSLQDPLKDIMHTSPHALPLGTSREHILGMMESVEIKQIPLLAADGTIAGIVTYNTLLGLRHAPRPNPVVIMAGGKGRRLLPITSDIPKPMVEIGNKPILEWILRRFIHQGFQEFHIAVNYLGHMIEQYFGNGSRFGCTISYIREEEFLGTAGALSLISSNIEHPLVVANGDILASVNFGDVMDSHMASGSIATICARAHHVEVPYGVIQLENGMMKAIVEKPVYEDLISAGMYALSPEALRYIPKNTVMDMPTVFTALLRDNKPVSVYSLQEEWMDIGRHDDLERAKQQFSSSSA